MKFRNPEEKNVLINYEKLRQLLGYDTYDRIKASHKEWVECLLSNGKNGRDEKWTMSIAVGNADFVQNIKSLMGALAKGRKGVEYGGSYQLREPQIPYNNNSRAKKKQNRP